MRLGLFIMAAALPWVLNALQAAGTYAAAHPIAVGAGLGGAQGAANGGGLEGALKGAAVGGLGSFAGGVLGDALGKIGAPAAALAKPVGSKSLVGALPAGVVEGAGSIAPNLFKGGGAITGGVAAPALADEIVVNASKPVGDAAAGALVSGVSTPPAEGAPPVDKSQGNSFGEKAGNAIGKGVVNQALNMMGPNIGAPAGPAGTNASPFVGAGASPIPPAGLSIKGSTAPNIYPWKAAA